jgi:hypothetical protein
MRGKKAKVLRKEARKKAGNPAPKAVAYLPVPLENVPMLILALEDGTNLLEIAAALRRMVGLKPREESLIIQPTHPGGYA